MVPSNSSPQVGGGSVDFLATREGVDPQAACCARLITQIIVQAVIDLGNKPSNAEKDAMRNLCDDARAAARFFFDPSSLFYGYAKAIGMNGHAFVERMQRNAVSFPGIGIYTDHARVVRIRRQWFLNEQAQTQRRAA